MATLVLAFQHISCYFLASVVKLQCPKCIQATEWKHRSSHHYWILFHSWSTTGLEGQPGLQNFVKLPSNWRPVWNHKQKKPGNDWMRKKYPSGPSDKDIKNIGSDWWAHSHISLTCQGKNNAMKSHTVYNSSGLNVYNVCATWDALPSINTHVFFPAHWVSSSAFASHSHWADGVRDGCRSRQEGQARDNRRYLKDLALQNQMFQK